MACGPAAGEFVWVKRLRLPWWPAVVVRKEDCRMHLEQKHSETGWCVRYIGEPENYDNVTLAKDLKLFECPEMDELIDKGSHVSLKRKDHLLLKVTFDKAVSIVLRRSQVSATTETSEKELPTNDFGINLNITNRLQRQEYETQQTELNNACKDCGKDVLKQNKGQARCGRGARRGRPRKKNLPNNPILQSNLMPRSVSLSPNIERKSKVKLTFLTPQCTPRKRKMDDALLQSTEPIFNVDDRNKLPQLAKETVYPSNILDNNGTPCKHSEKRIPIKLVLQKKHKTDDICETSNSGPPLSYEITHHTVLRKNLTKPKSTCAQLNQVATSKSQTDANICKDLSLEQNQVCLSEYRKPSDHGDISKCKGQTSQVKRPSCKERNSATQDNSNSDGSDIESDGSDIESDDSDLPEFSQQNVERPVNIGDIVWAKYGAHPFWPAVIKSCYKRGRQQRVTVIFLGPSKWQRYLFRMKYHKSAVRPFNAAFKELEEDAVGTDVHEDVMEAIKQAQDFFFKRALREEGTASAMEYFFGSNEPSEENPDMEHAEENDMSETVSFAGESSEQISKQATLSDYVDDDDVDDHDDEPECNTGKGMSASLQKSVYRRKDQNQKLVDLIKGQRVKNYMMKVMKGEVQSTWVDEYEKDPKTKKKKVPTATLR